MAEPRVLGIVLAGGAGKRLGPLTADRAKPAVPFGGQYRLIDFALSNLVNSGCLRVCVLTQYKSHSLDRHVTTTWRMSSLLGNYVTPVPAQQRRGPHWYTGSADAIYQSLNLIYDERPDIVVVFGADHVFRMDARQMISQHVQSGASVTVAGHAGAAEGGPGVRRHPGRPRRRTIEAFLEKPADPPALPGRPDETYASMGNYVFTSDALVEALRKDAVNDEQPARHGRRHHPDAGQRAQRAGVRLPDNEVPGATGAGHRVLARRRDAGLLFRRAHGPVRDRPGLQPVQRPVADLHQRAVAGRRPSSCTTRATGSAGRSTAWSATA